MYDFNILERSATSHRNNGEFDKALAIYFYMAAGDTSLDAGYLGVQIGKCYEDLGQIHTANYWYGRALEENPVVRADCVDAQKRLGDLSIDKFLINEV